MRRPDPPADVARTTWTGGGRVAHGLQLLATFVAALVPRLLTVGNHVTGDEGIWMLRTSTFSSALLDLDLSKATASQGGPATMPGGPTMWLGSAGRLGLSIADRLGLADGDRFLSLSGLEAAQIAVAVATSLLIVLIAYLVNRWSGWGAAAVVALLLVGEPWLVGLGSVLHTDELTALFGIAGLLLLALTFDVPDRGRLARPVLTAGLAGFLLMQAPLTKVVGLAYGVGAVLVIAFAFWRDWGRPDEDGSALLRRRAYQLAAAVVGVVVAVPLAWPAVVADPSTQIAALGDSIALGGRPREQFFLGELTTTPGWSYYLVALPLRVTPWFLFAFVVAVPLGLVRAASRAKVVWALVWALPAWVAISQAALQYDRYGLLVLVPVALVPAVALGPYLERVLDESAPLRGAAAALALAVAIYATLVAPWGLLYFNPALGGGERAEDTLLVGWGEGVEQAAASILELEGGSCAGVTVGSLRPNIFGTRSVPAPLAIFGVPCTTPPPKGEEPDYVIDYINDRQRTREAVYAKAIAGREQVDTIEIRGIPVATIWR